MANPLAPHIQQRVDEDTANVPSYHGNFKDVITLPVFINRIDMGIETLLWTQQVAFTYFSNALKDVAAAWLECYITDNPQAPKTWEHFKPEIRKAFGDTTDPVIFAQEVSNIKPEQHNNSLFKYYAAISRVVTLHQEEFPTPPLPPLPQDHGLNAAQLQIVNQIHITSHTAAIQAVHAKLRKEFFLNGLPKRQLDMVVNKPYLTTVHEMIAYIHQQESIATKKNGNTTTVPLPSVQAVHVQSNVPQEQQQQQQAATASAVNFSNNFNRTQSQRGGGNQQQAQSTYRGNNYRGNNFNRGANRGYRGGGNFQQNDRQTTTSSTFGGKTCIYCRKPGHIQDDCFIRIEKNDPCINSQGRNYFPKPKVSANEEISSSSVFFLEN